MAAVYETADALLEVKESVADPVQWRAVPSSDAFVRLRDILREDPFSNRAVVKPRGYAGDAILLDMAYRLIQPSVETSEIGRVAFEATTNSPGSRSVRRRKHDAAAFIDSCAEEFIRPRIASVACGHLRELDVSEAFKSGAIGYFLGVDQDAASIAHVKQTLSERGVATCCASLKEFLQRKIHAESFDAIYSIGLYDYLDTDTAVKVTRALHTLLRPGGRMLIANLAPTLRDIPFMEAVMDWWMIYRSPEELRQLVDSAIGKHGSIDSFSDLLNNVAYAEFRRSP